MRMTVQEILQAVDGRLVLPGGKVALSAPAAAPSATLKMLDEQEILALEVTSVTWDSRDVSPGALFLALEGARVDGHDFAYAAARAGAYVVLVSHEVDAPVAQIVVTDVQAAFTQLAAFWRARLHGTVIGITGSTGKTTTKDLVRDVLGSAGSVVATAANQNNELGVPRTLLQAETDTEFVIVEMGMRGLGQIAELCACARPDWGIVTKVGVSHLELLGSEDNIVRAKAELYAALPIGGIAFVNVEDEHASDLCVYGALGERGIRMVGVSAHESGEAGSAAVSSEAVAASTISSDEMPNTDAVDSPRASDAPGSDASSRLASSPNATAELHSACVCGLQNRATETSEPGAPSSPSLSSEQLGEQVVYARDVRLDDEGHPSFTLSCVFPNGRVQSAPCTLQLRGLHNVSNACMAAAVGVVAGLSVAQCARALGTSQASEGRQSFSRTAAGTLVMDDSYNANPDSMYASLSTFATLQVDGKRIAVLGDMSELGEAGREGHRRVGRAAACAGLDLLICAGELSRDIAQSAIDAGMPQTSVQLADDATQALRKVKEVIGSKDAVLVKASHSMGFDKIVEGLMK